MPYTLDRPPALRELAQVYTYLYRMSEEIESAFNSLTSSDITDLETKVEAAITKGTGSTPGTIDLSNQNRELKALIINTADIIEASMDSITQELHGRYVAKSDFGTVTEDYLSTMTRAADGETIIYKLVENVNEYTNHIQGQIRSGYFYDANQQRRFGIAIGLNLGTEDDVDQTQTMSIFDSEKLEFWVKGSCVAYISNQKLYITRGHFTREIRIGNLAGVIDGQNANIVRWYAKED